MAGIIDYQPDLANGRVFAMWHDEKYQYRSNIALNVGAIIPIHKHSYDHRARVQGMWKVTENGNSVLLQDGMERVIPKYTEHEFELLAFGPTGVGSVLCYWPQGTDQ